MATVFVLAVVCPAVVVVVIALIVEVVVMRNRPDAAMGVKPMFWEVGKLGPDYYKWVHQPSSVTSFRMFETNFVEYFSKTAWQVIPAVWLPYVIGMSYLSLHCGGASAMEESAFVCQLLGPSDQTLRPGEFVAAFCSGVLCWTLLEFFLHR